MTAAGDPAPAAPDRRVGARPRERAEAAAMDVARGLRPGARPDRMVRRVSPGPELPQVAVDEHRD